MTIDEFDNQCTGSFIDEKGIKLIVSNRSFHDNGGLEIIYPNDPPRGGTYYLRLENSKLFFRMEGNEFLLSPTQNGFELIMGETIAYNFSRLV